MPVSPSATTLTRVRQRTTVSSASTPSVLATSTRLWLSPYDAETCTTAPSDERAELFMRISSSTLSDLVTLSGSRSTAVHRRCAPTRFNATTFAPPFPPRAAAAAASAADAQAGLRQVGGVGEPGGLAGDDADAGAAVAAAGHLLDPTVVEPRRSRVFVLGVDLGEVAARSHRRPQHPFQTRRGRSRRPTYPSVPIFGVRVQRRRAQRAQAGSTDSTDQRRPMCVIAGGDDVAALGPVADQQPGRAGGPTRLADSGSGPESGPAGTLGEVAVVDAGQLDDEMEARGDAGDARSGQVLGERRHRGVAALAVDPPGSPQVTVVGARREEPGECRVLQRRSSTVGRELERGDAFAPRRRRRDPAEPQTPAPAPCSPCRPARPRRDARNWTVPTGSRS